MSAVINEIALDNLESLGWGPAWAMKFKPLTNAGLCPGRVFAEQREIYHVQSQHGEALARVSGRMRHEARDRAGFPAVGDRVAIDATDGGGRSVIHALLPRFNRFSRKLAGKETDEQIVAANLDTLFLVTCDDDDRGRHTTTHREMFRLPRGGLLIDNPGMRELQLWNDGVDLDSTFTDVADLAARCHYRDCRHEQEPQCAVREALENGTLDGRRIENFRKLQRELAYLESQQDPSAGCERKERDRRIHRIYNKVNMRRERR
jgi:putative ribosome biogenesis GTPase RsgA